MYWQRHKSHSIHKSERAFLTTLRISETSVFCLSTDLASDILLDQLVLSLVIEDNVDLLGTGTTDVRTCWKGAKTAHNIKLQHTSLMLYQTMTLHIKNY